MIIEMDRKSPQYLIEGKILSSLPLKDMVGTELAKVYAYELWRTKSATDPSISLILDEIARQDETLLADLRCEIADLENEIDELRG